MLPQTVRVKLSTEAVDAAAITPVVVQQVATRDLIGQMLGLTGKDPGRVVELLRRGTLVRGASRYRWQGWEADREEVAALLGTFPDPDPDRAFDASRCIRVVLREGSRALELTVEEGRKRRVFRRNCFWDTLMRVAAANQPHYVEYCYSEHTDRYRTGLTLDNLGELRAAAQWLAHASWRAHVMTAAFGSAELYATRG